MQDTQLLNEGLSLMALGMGFVFVFLTVLVITTTLMSRVIGRYFPEPVPVEAPKRGAAPAAPGQDDAVMAAISAAVHRYRQRR
ncbi:MULTISPECIES: OadG family transporter subunit [Halomonas]|jgi:oxaloacetate decarboxylase gamma subunit|uniref:Probable oxaloacetate decarboxylase gamma chain n=3 Tax=Halomonas TaxID=2745 RepID=A0AAU7KFQ3_9GAMM|nr:MULTISPECIES: OadG family transporter subunit [Halomonas]MBR9770067.1 sodium pump decarboxylase subunit gamma [Gammaproteobacteria bacterium]HAR08247.1 sodium pump decarboxylase subunit gamma [Cobetia sp.]KJZ17704.1 sodium pump decarboxylase subunit gamma [Halomonas sp. S2151]MAR74467.1 sodium pump decarboxylase subunit gamma [Halomonas sp.]MBR9880404.1 sodium pump decarboxylase subunit gamma [Gammaproteobacteria bacterium]|tara:strand:+ start:648 stop:896 length:249 start_codon:yes stop_codon:yes gene_type:complete